MATDQHALGADPRGDPPEPFGDAEFLQTLRQQMLKFATLQLSDDQLAEDVVQDAIIGALRNARSFKGKSALKTWVFAILKNKIADGLRQRHRSKEVNVQLRQIDDEEDMSELFDNRGYWLSEERPAAWGNPHEALRERQFWSVFETCLERLPGSQARVFMMREFVELRSDEICSEVGITVTNLNVMLHRARLRLRECLENRWFAEGAPRC